jgi:hypothetical protein
MAELCTKKTVAIMLGMFEKVFGKRDDKEPEITIELWHRFLCDEPADLVQGAADKYIAGNKFFPKPTEILELIEKEKQKIFQTAISVDLFADNIEDALHGRTTRVMPPAEYLPRGRRPKQYEQSNQERTIRAIKGFDKIGALPKAEGEL